MVLRPLHSLPPADPRNPPDATGADGRGHRRKEIIALAERKGLQIVAWYVDEGISGDEIEKRPDLCRMLADARTGKFQFILCWDQDRFGRFDSLRAGYVIESLRMAGVKSCTAGTTDQRTVTSAMASG